MQASIGAASKGAALFAFIVTVACGPGSAQDSALRNPAGLTEQAPATFSAAFDTSKGRFVVEVHREWAPLGADRFYNLVKSGFFNDVRFFRVIGGQLAQFGMHGEPAVQEACSTTRVRRARWSTTLLLNG